jgi:hypothetical protein
MNRDGALTKQILWWNAANKTHNGTEHHQQSLLPATKLSLNASLSQKQFVLRLTIEGKKRAGGGRGGGIKQSKNKTAMQRSVDQNPCRTPYIRIRKIDTRAHNTTQALATWRARNTKTQNSPIIYDYIYIYIYTLSLSLSLIPHKKEAITKRKIWKQHART